MRFIIVLMLIGFLSVAKAQDCKKYNDAMKAGETFLRDSLYDKALIEFQTAQIAARECGVNHNEPANEIATVFKKLQQQRDEAIKDRIKAKTALAKADTETKRADENAESAEMQTTKALQYAALADSQKLSAQKAFFRSNLKDRTWWNRELWFKNKRLESYITDSMFSWYYPTYRKSLIECHRDSIRAVHFERSLEYLAAAYEHRHDFLHFLFLLKKAKNESADNVFAIASLNHILSNSLSFERRYSLGSRFDNIISVKFLSKQNEQFIALHKYGIYKCQVSYPGIFELNLPVDNEAIAISDNVSKLICYNKSKHNFTIYNIGADKFEKPWAVNIAGLNKELFEEDNQAKDLKFQAHFSADNIFLFLQIIINGYANSYLLNLNTHHCKDLSLLKNSRNKMSQRQSEGNYSPKQIDDIYRHYDWNWEVMGDMDDTIFCWHNRKVVAIDTSENKRWIISADSDFIYLRKNNALLIKEEDIFKYGDDNIRAFYGREGYFRYLNNEWANAALYYDTAASLGMRDAENIFYMGYCFEHIGQYDSAISILNRVLLDDPKYSRGWFELGNIYDILMKDSLSRACYTMAQKGFGPDDHSFETPKGYDQYDTYESVDQMFRATWLDLSADYAKMGDTSLAIKYIKKAALGNNNDAYILFKIAQDYCLLCDWSKADDFVSKAIGLKSSDIDFFAFRAYVNARKGDTIKSNMDLLFVDSLNSNIKNIYTYKDKFLYFYYLSCYYSFLNNHETAIKLLNLSIDKGLKDISHLENDDLLKKIRLDKIYNYALTRINKPLTKDDIFSSNSYSQLERIYQGHMGFESDTPNTSTVFNPKEASAFILGWPLLAAVYESEGKTDLANEFNVKIARQKKYSAEFWYDLIDINFDLKKYQPVINFIDTVLKVDSTRYNFYNLYLKRGYSNLKLGLSDDGFRDLTKALVIDSSSAEAYFYLTCYYSVKENGDLAITNLQKALDKGFNNFELLENESMLQYLWKDERYGTILEEAMNSKH